MARRSMDMSKAAFALGRRLFSSYPSVAGVQSALVPAQTSASFLKWTSPVPVKTQHLLTPTLAGPATQITTLPNGLRVATEEHAHAKTATVGVWIDAGSRFESDAPAGTAHFLEHLIFKGTNKRSQAQLEVEVENMGGHLNAYTSREQTTYYARVTKENVGGAVDILSDILTGSKLDSAAVERERGVILREMEEVGKDGAETLFDHLHATAFQFSPLGRTILGSADNVRTITSGDLADYIATHYTAPRMVVCAAGAVDHESFVKLVSDKFSSLPTKPSHTAYELATSDPAIFTGSDVRFQDSDATEHSFVLAFQGLSWTDGDSTTLQVMQAMLGSWDARGGMGTAGGSQLSQFVASNKLCTNYMAFNTSYIDTGLFGVYAVTKDTDSLFDLAWATTQAFTKLIYDPNEDDVTRAKNQLKAQLLASSNADTTAACEDIGRQLLTYGRRLSRAEMCARIDAVDVEQVRKVAERLFHDQDPVVAAMGDVSELPDYNWLRRRTYWFAY